MSLKSGSRDVVVPDQEALPPTFLLGQNRVLSLLAQGSPIDQVLVEFCHVLEFSHPDTRACVMLLDPKDRRLQVGAGPSLPEEFRQAIDGIAAGSGPGSCSAAIHRNETTISSDMTSDRIWEGMRDTVAQSSLRACWSAPIRGVRAEQGKARDEVLALGTVAFYFDQPRQPNRRDLMVLEMSSALASLAISVANTQERIGRQQLYDPVTGLPNRRVFTQKLKELLESATPREDKLAVLLLDLDHFKEVNDTLGYAVGDFLLRSVAERLLAFRHPSDLLARFGDDQFAFLISEVSRNEDIRQNAEAILHAVAEPFDFSGQQLAVTACLGASLYPWDGEDSQTLLRNAENALEAAKQQGRNRVRIYAPTMGGYAFEKLQLKMALGYAVENQELEVLFQPKVDATDGRIVGAEALLYWNHPSEGRLSPGEFIPLAEESGLIISIGDWVLRSVCQQFRDWQRQHGLHDFHVAVNISALQFRERGFVERVAAIVERSQLEKGRLELEITETIAMTEVETTLPRMRELARLGVQLAIDDFGTGYSSLAYLKRFPIQTLKIDKSFVAKLPEDKENRAIVKAVIALAHYLGLSLVAEGVETGAQATFLRDQGCELLQGYFYSLPVSADDFANLLRDGTLRGS